MGSEAAYTVHLNKSPREAIHAQVDGIVFWYVPQNDAEAGMSALLRGFQDEYRNTLSELERQKALAFFRSMGPGCPAAEETIAVTVGSHTNFLQLQYAWVQSFPVVWVQNITVDRNALLQDHFQRNGVTGAFTREAFAEQLAHRPKTGTLAVVRVDQLDHVNDALGSLAGDRVLREQAKTLSALLREGELLGRYGGAEFLLYLTQASREVLEERLRIICTLLTRSIGPEVTVFAHLGAVHLGGETGTFDELYEKARLALRSIRWKGEGDCFIYTPELRALQGPVPDVMPRSASDSRIFVRTFGYFDVFVDGEPVHFQGGQAKELMALLVDRRGGYVSSNEAIACLWEDEPANKTTLARLRKVAMRLKNSLEDAGIQDILQSKSGERRVVPEKFQCDYYEFLEKGARSGMVFPGTYMTNYSWAESTLANLAPENEE